MKRKTIKRKNIYSGKRIRHLLMTIFLGAALICDSMTVTAKGNKESEKVKVSFILPDAVTEIEGVSAYDEAVKIGIDVSTDDAIISQVVLCISGEGREEEAIVYENDGALCFVEGRVNEIYRLTNLLEEIENGSAGENGTTGMGDETNETGTGATGTGEGANGTGTGTTDNVDGTGENVTGTTGTGDGGSESTTETNDGINESGTDENETSDSSVSQGGISNESNDEVDNDNNEGNEDDFENNNENNQDSNEGYQDSNNDGSQSSSGNSNTDNNSQDSNPNEESVNNEGNNTTINDDSVQVRKEEIENELSEYKKTLKDNHKLNDIFELTEEGKYTIKARIKYYDCSYDFCNSVGKTIMPEMEEELNEILSDIEDEITISQAVIIDLNSPSITGYFTDNESGYWFNHSREAKINFSDRYIDYNSVKLIIDGSELPVEKIDENGLSIFFDGDGNHNASVSIKDLLGRESVYETGEFSIDTTPPLIKVNISDADKKYTSKKRKATITIEDSNLTGEAEREYVFKEGEDSFEIKARDAAGNESIYTSDVFIQDFKSPEVNLSGITDEQIINGEININVNVKDKWLDKNNSYVEIKGENTGDVYLYNFILSDEANIIIKDSNEFKDDIYTLKYSFSDLASNKEEGELSFTLNRNGSTFEVSDELKRIMGTYVNEVSDISLTERNISRIIPERIKLIFAVNSRVIDLVLGRDYCINESYENGRYVYVYKFDKKLFDKEGVYTISLSSVDEAGNQNDTRLQKDTDGIRFVIEFIKDIFFEPEKEAESYVISDVLNEVSNITDIVLLREIPDEFNAASLSSINAKTKSHSDKTKEIQNPNMETSQETFSQDRDDSLPEVTKKKFNNKIKIALSLALILSILVIGARIAQNKKIFAK